MGEIEIGDLIVEWDDNKTELNFKSIKFILRTRREFFSTKTGLMSLMKSTATTRNAEK